MLELRHVGATQAAHPMMVRRLAIAVISFLTLVDLFAAQAILPQLADSYRVSPATMGLAVNASTFGMAAAGLAVALAGSRIPRRTGIVASLALLSIPTALLSLHPPLATFSVLRIAQGVFMSSAFTLTMAYLAEESGETVAAALAAYVTGNVASNLVGRLMSAYVADHAGLAANFLALAGLNVAGALLVRLSFMAASDMMRDGSRPARASAGMRAAWRTHLANPALTAAFGIGFLILFAFIGTFTYVNFVLVGAPLSLSPMSLGLVYFIFLPALLLTPFAGHLAAAAGPVTALRLSVVAAIVGLPLTLAHGLAPVLLGLALIGAGTFAAQAIATGIVGRLANRDRGAASGLYLASYYLGGLVGSAVLGRVFDRAGWTACVLTIAASLAAAVALTLRLEPTHRSPAARQAHDPAPRIARAHIDTRRHPDA